MKAREVLLLILIVAAGVFFHYAHTGKLNLDGDWEWGIFDFGVSYSYEESQTIEAPLPARLEVRNAHGDIDVRSADQEDIRLTLHKKIRRRKEAEAREVADMLKPVITRTGDRIIISSNRGEFKKRNFETSFTLVVPRNMGVTIENSYGTVKAAGIRGGEIVNPHGEVAVADVGGELAVTNSYEDVDIEGVGASCRVSAKHSDVSVRNVGGEVSVDHSYGKVIIEDTAADATVRGDHTEVDGQRIKGRVDVRTSYERISLRDVGPAVVNGHHAAVEAEGVAGGLSVATSYENVRVEDIRGDLTVEGKSVEVTGRSIAAREVRITTSYENLDLAGYSGSAIISLSHGDAVLAPSSLDFPIEVKNVYSTVRLFLPKGERGPIEVRSRGGEIKWGLAEPPSVNQTNGEAVVKAFLDRIQRPGILLSTTYGDIYLEEATGPRAE
jgi:hypothetical protein